MVVYSAELVVEAGAVIAGDVALLVVSVSVTGQTVVETAMTAVTVVADSL